MLRPYDIEILPCTFLQEPAGDDTTCSTHFNRKRTTTIELKNISKILNGCELQQSGSAYPASSYRLRPKWIGQSQHENDEMISVSKKLYETLSEQNRIKQERICELQEQLSQLQSRYDDQQNVIGCLLEDGGRMPDTARLKEVIDYNNIRDRKKGKK